MTHIKPKRAGGACWVPGRRHMWRFTGRAYGVVLSFKCHGCQLTTSIHSKRFWGKVY